MALLPSGAYASHHGPVQAAGTEAWDARVQKHTRKWHAARACRRTRDSRRARARVRESAAAYMSDCSADDKQYYRQMLIVKILLLVKILLHCYCS